MGVFTHISEEELSFFLNDYNLKNVESFIGINEGIQNTNYKTRIDSKDFILTIYENINENNDLDFFLSLMNYLSSQGIKCPTPIKNSSLNYIGKIKSKPAALLTFLNGKSTLNIKKNHTFEIGKVLAEMHISTKDFPMKKKNDLSINGWEKLLIKNKDKINKFESNLFEKIKNKIIKIKEKWPKNLPSGIIHGDLFPDNVFFINDKITGVIDFYFSCTDILTYDLAIAINAWCFDKQYNFQDKKYQALLKGYNSKRKLSKDEEFFLPLLCQAASLRFLLTRLFDWVNTPIEANVVLKNPEEYITKHKHFKKLVKNIKYVEN